MGTVDALNAQLTTLQIWALRQSLVFNSTVYIFTLIVLLFYLSSFCATPGGNVQPVERGHCLVEVDDLEEQIRV